LVTAALLQTNRWWDAGLDCVIKTVQEATCTFSLQPAKRVNNILTHAQTQAYTLTALPLALTYGEEEMERWRENEIRVEVRVTTNWGYSANGHLKIKNGSE
jgi:hypothetical protein